MLNLKPVISCNQEGIYYTVAKVRGKKRSIQKTIDLAVEFAGQAKKYDVALAFGGTEAEKAMSWIRDAVKNKLPNIQTIYEGQISPALGVHTGPGLIGIAISLIED